MCTQYLLLIIETVWNEKSYNRLLYVIQTGLYSF